MAINNYYIGGYGGYYKLNYHRQWLLIIIILVDISGYYWLNYHKLLMAIILVVIDGYY